VKSRGSQCNETLSVRAAVRPGKKLGLRDEPKCSRTLLESLDGVLLLVRRVLTLESVWAPRITFTGGTRPSYTRHTYIKPYVSPSTAASPHSLVAWKLLFVSQRTAEHELFWAGFKKPVFFKAQPSVFYQPIHKIKTNTADEIISAGKKNMQFQCWVFEKKIWGHSLKTPHCGGVRSTWPDHTTVGALAIHASLRTFSPSILSTWVFLRPWIVLQQQTAITDSYHHHHHFQHLPGAAK